MTPNAVSGPHAAEFSLRHRAAGPGVQIVSAGGVVALAEARRLEFVRTRRGLGLVRAGAL